jgi:hypothetical protein
VARRRRARDEGGTLVAAASRIDLRQKAKAPKRQDWQADAWLYYDAVPEVKQLINWRANQMAKLRLFVATMPPDGGPEASPIPASDPDSGIPESVWRRAEEELARLRARIGGQAEIKRRLEINMETVGEALDVATLVATPTGFTMMGDLRAGDEVLGGDGRPCTVLVAHPVREDRECYEVGLRGGVRVVADAEHLWLTHQRFDREYDRGFGRAYEPTVVRTAEMAASVKVGGASNHAIELARIVGGEPAIGAEIDPYVLGYWLGDGTSSQGALTIHPDDQPHVRERVEAAGYGWSPRPGDARGFSIGVLGLHAQLNRMGLLRDKHIPPAYLRHTEPTRWSLLQGLIDSDGHVDRHGKVEFSNRSERLLWDVVELAASLGLKPSRPARHRVHFVSAGMPVASLPRKAERIAGADRAQNRWRYVESVERVKSRPVRCITVDSPDSTFLVTQHLVRTHNCYVVGFAEREPDEEGKGGSPEEWMVCSISEVSSRSKGALTQWTVKLRPDDAKGRVLDPEAGDDIFRIWQPHGQWLELADCALRSALDECETLQLLSNQVKAESRSRVSAGFLCVPNELSFAGVKPKVEQPDGQGQDAAEGDKFLDELVDFLVAPIDDPSHQASVVPGLIRGPGDAMTDDKLRHLAISRQSDETLDKRIEARVTRLARGLNAPVEVVQGLMQTTFANAEQVDQDVWEDYLEPRAVFDVDAFTVGFLLPRLADDTAIPEDMLSRLFVWYDASDLVAQPDLAGNASEAHDRFEISGMAYRRYKGYDEDDAPEPIEVLVRAALRRGALTPELTRALLLALADEAGVELPVPTEEAPEPGQAAAARIRALARLLLNDARAEALTALVGPGNGQGAQGQGAALRGRSGASRAPSGADAGRRLAAIDRDLRTRLLVATNDAMGRALERAGNRLKSRSSTMRERLRSVPPALAASTLGPSLVAQAGVTEDALLEGAFDALEVVFKAWGGTAQRQALDLVSRFVSGFSVAQRDGLGLRLAESLDEAWGWLHGSLVTLARAQLYDPTPLAETLGEFDPTLRVPPGLVRQAIARAGGTMGLQATDGGGAYVVLAEGGGRPPGGIATGELLRSALRDAGGGVEGYVWEYGPAVRARPFEPHLELDGVQFENFDDPALANGEGWPEFAFFMPGDHDGCLCDAVPVLLSPEGAARVIPEAVSEGA